MLVYHHSVSVTNTPDVFHDKVVPSKPEPNTDLKAAE